MKLVNKNFHHSNKIPMKFARNCLLLVNLIFILPASDAAAELVHDYVTNPMTRVPLPHLNSWVGTRWNDSKGAPGGLRKMADNSIGDIAVTKEGMVYINSEYDEDGAAAIVIGSDGSWKGNLSNWGLRGQAITIDEASGFVYVHDAWNENRGGEVRNHATTPAHTDSWIHRIPLRHMADPAKGAPPDSYLGFKVFPDSNPYKKRYRLHSLATQGGELFVADPNDHTIKVYDLATWPASAPAKAPTLRRSLPMTDVLKMTCDPATGNLWVIQNRRLGADGFYSHKDTEALFPNSNYTDVYPFSAKVHLLDKTTGAILKTISDLKNPTNLALHPKDKTLWICEAGRDYQIRIYRDLDTVPVLDRTFGERFGILSKPAGLWAPRKLMYPTGVGFDGAGNIYVAQANGPMGWAPIRLESYTEGGDFRWSVDNLGAIETAVFDPLTEDVFGSHARMSMDFSKKDPGTEWSFKGYTLNAYKYPQDSRFDLGRNFSNPYGIRHIDGHKFLFISNAGTTSLAWYRFDSETDGETAIPTGAMRAFNAKNAVNEFPYPNVPSTWTGDKQFKFLWMDSDGNGNIAPGELQEDSQERNYDDGVLCVDSEGDIWTANQAGIYRYLAGGTARLAGGPKLGPQGVPIYKVNERIDYKLPDSDFSLVKRIEADLSGDALYISGDTASHPDTTNESYGQAGRVLKKYTGIATGKLSLAYTIIFPQIKEGTGSELRGPGNLSIAGDYLFAAHRKGLELVHVFRKSTGEYVGELTPGPYNKDCFDDQALGLRAFQRKNGEYLIFYQRSYGPSMMYRWSPLAINPSQLPQ